MNIEAGFSAGAFGFSSELLQLSRFLSFSLLSMLRGDFRFGSKAAVTASTYDFRYGPGSGHNSDMAACPKSARS
jgi:hypothetical protein